ncbi:MAG: hypothetical protein ABJB17_11795 [Burkholderiales bacterium]
MRSLHCSLHRALSLGLTIALLAGCAMNPFFRPQVGMSRAEVIGGMGPPTAVVALGGGAERLQYSQQPQGQYVTMVDLDAVGRVQAAEQVMDEAHFARIELGRWTRSDIERAFGPPGRVDHVASWRGDIWQYRWRQGLIDKYFWVFLDPAGVVRQAYSGTQYEDAPGETDGSGLP